MDRLHHHFGADPIRQLSQNLSKMKLVTMYSGLGGAELSALLLKTALNNFVRENELPCLPLRDPECLLACEMNSDCHKVLRTHHVSWM